MSKHFEPIDVVLVRSSEDFGMCSEHAVSFAGGRGLSRPALVLELLRTVSDDLTKEEEMHTK
jgi:hypothetical protein